jgi:hypothetical protein
MFRASFSLLGAVLILGACSGGLQCKTRNVDGQCVSASALSPTESPGPNVVAPVPANSSISVSMDWGEDEFVESGLATTDYNMTGLAVSGNEGRASYCFENNNPCRRADVGLRETSFGNNPVAIQGFRLNFKAATSVYKSVTITSASVTTAEIKFFTGSGEVLLENPVTRDLVGSNCSLGDPNSVGFASTDRVITGLYFFEEATASQTVVNQFTNGHIKAARVLYAGLIPFPKSSSDLFQFDFAPKDPPPEAAAFGLDGFASSDSASVRVSPQFEAANDPSYKRVLTGFCLNGTKVLATGTSLPDGRTTRPILLYSGVRSYRPRLVKID